MEATMLRQLRAARLRYCNDHPTSAFALESHVTLGGPTLALGAADWCLLQDELVI
jgi:hypothetical protein